MKWQPDVWVSNIGMAEKDGFARIRKVRQLSPERGGRIRRAALTADPRIEDRTRSLLGGFQIHLQKPVDPAALRANHCDRPYQRTDWFRGEWEGSVPESESMTIY